MKQKEINYISGLAHGVVIGTVLTLLIRSFFV